MKAIILSLILTGSTYVFSQENRFNDLNAEFDSASATLEIPATELDYSVNFSNIGNDLTLSKQAEFFYGFRKRLSAVDAKTLDAYTQIRYKRMAYEISENLERITLEKKWRHSKKPIPENGLHALSNYKEWYRYYVKHFTGLEVQPESVFVIGKEEVKRAREKIAVLRKHLGYTNEELFYAHLDSGIFFLNTKQEILKGFASIDSTVRKNMSALFNTYTIPGIEAMEWPGATASTPPGIYLNKENNPYGVDVFQFNFSNKKYNKRCMDWLYLHEAIPGHHLQSAFREQNGNYFYFGTVEGWACYVEDFGKELGLYSDPYSLLGKEEWNLVRSARLVMEVGIHYYGWSYDRAMLYWKETIKGQDDIADREIRRVTKWPGQSLCYKIGALTIQKIVAQKIKEGFSIQEAHQFILEHSDFPLQSLL